MRRSRRIPWQQGTLFPSENPVILPPSEVLKELVQALADLLLAHLRNIDGVALKGEEHEPEDHC